tara:strand:+ start:1527 stop:2066 length:540 start_codon:yes stop_codon:yes gene_type:complete
MFSNYVYSRHLFELYNKTNSTIINEHTQYIPPIWITLSWYGILLFILSCVLTFKIKICNSEKYAENFVCCCFLIYRDIVIGVFILIIKILFLLFDCLCCNFNINNKDTDFIYKKINKTKNTIYENFNNYKFKITNKLYPINACMVENSNINTSIVIEGLNNNNNVISIIVVPIDDIVIN